jgi:hypothetical protein
VTRITAAIHEDLYTSLVISGRIILTMRYVPGKLVEKIKIYVLCSYFFKNENRADYGTMENCGKSDRSRMSM